jgi:hypothetical protein
MLQQFAKTIVSTHSGFSNAKNRETGRQGAKGFTCFLILRPVNSDWLSRDDFSYERLANNVRKCSKVPTTFDTIFRNSDFRPISFEGRFFLGDKIKKFQTTGMQRCRRLTSLFPNKVHCNFLKNIKT